MPRGFVPLILLASFLYAATYLFIKVAVEEIPPATLVAARLLLAAPIFVVILALTRGFEPAISAVRAEWRAGLVLGVVSFAIPITLLALGERWVTSGVAAIGIATTPIFVQMLARRFRPSEQVAGRRLVGIAVGFGGVALLTGGSPGSSWAEIGGTIAIVAAALSFAVALLYAQTSLVRSSVLTIATASSIGGGLVMIPLGLWQLPDQMPGAKAVGALLGLTVVNSIGSQLLSWHIVMRFGPARNSLSTYLTPPMALLLGVLVLHESVSSVAVGALALILVGVAVSSGVLSVHPTRQDDPERSAHAVEGAAAVRPDV